MRFGRNEPPREVGKLPVAQGGDVLARDLERPDAVGVNPSHFRPSERGERARIGVEYPQDAHDGRGGLDGAVLIFCEGARPAAEQLPRLDLRKAEFFSDTANLIRAEVGDLLTDLFGDRVHFMYH